MQLPLLIGQPITGRDLEQITSPWSPEHFASMCDALAWAASGRQFPTMPSFTFRVNAADGGIDAEWDIEIPKDKRSIPTPLLGPGWNVLQYKKRDLMAQDRSKIISNLKSGLLGAVEEIYNRFDRTPDRYVLFVNVDLKHDQARAIKEAILSEYSHPSDLHIEVVGAAELVALLNNHPHLRAAYFVPISFKTWEAAYRAHRSHKFLGADVELIERKKEIGRLLSLVQNKKVRVIIITGPHDIGKSRLVLEATRDRPHDVIIALDPRSMDISDYHNLSSSSAETIAIVEDPEPDFIESLAIEALNIPNLKVIITLPTPSFVPAPSYGRDERIQNIHLDPLDEKTSHDLLKATGQPLDFGIEEWIIRQAKGIPGIILAAASVGSELRREWGDFLSAVGREFEKRIQSELGNETLNGAELFSILTHVGISREFEAEIRHICNLFGGGWKPADAIRVLETLEQAGLARRGGSFAEISIPILANYFANKVLVGRRNEVFALFARLEESGRLRFLRRLSEIQGPDIESFWDEFFGPAGPLRDFESALSNAHIVHLVSGTVPLRTLKLLESGLLNTNREQRLSIAGEDRREIMWALEQLLFRIKTSRGALKLIWLLAEAENEDYGNNATGVLTECFHPQHTQMPLPLDERIEALKEFTADSVSRDGRIVVIEAAGEALSPGSYTLRHSTGPEPLASMPQFTYGDFYDYVRDLVDILVSAATDEDRDVASAALKVLPNLIGEYAIQGRPQEGITRFQILIDWALAAKPGLEVSSLFDAMSWVRRVFSDRLEKRECPPEREEEQKRLITELVRLKAELERGGFLIRLKHWAGNWTTEDDEDVNVNGKDVPRYELQLEQLAEEAINKPQLLNVHVIKWLLSDSAQKSHTYFFYLGLRDTEGILRHAIEQLEQQSEGKVAFSAYWGGWASRDQEGAEARLEELATLNNVTGQAIIQTTSSIKASQAALERIKAQIKAGRIEPAFAGRLLMGRWTYDLDPVQFEDLLCSVVGDQLENASTAIHMLMMYRHLERSLDSPLGEFAWRCLESDPPLKPPVNAWHFDKLAAKLAQTNPERGFKLFKKLLLKKRGREHWDPIDRYGKHQFWNVLYETDKESLLELIFNVGQVNSLLQYRVTWSLQDILDMERDRDLLISFAKRDEALANIISKSISSAKPGFRSIASELVQMYRTNEKIKRNLAAGIEQQGHVIAGPFSRFYEGRRAYVEQWLNDPRTPPAVRPWLREMLDRLQRRISHEIVWEYDEDVNDLRRYIDDKDSPERIWAIGRVLKYGNPKDWKELLSVKDIEDALPQIDLPEKKRKVIERALKVWMNEV